MKTTTRDDVQIIDEQERKNALISMQVFIIAGTLLLTLIITVICVGIMVRYEVDSDVSNVASIPYWSVDLPREQEIWYEKGIEELTVTLNRRPLKQHPRNVLLFVANGISPETLAAARFLQAKDQQMEYTMSWDQFPYFCKLKNSCSNTDICDAFTVSTALYGGVQTHFKIGGLDGAVDFRNCTTAANKTHHIKSVLQFAQEIGMRTGFVTTQRVTGPTIAALYAHTPDTSWECDATMPPGQITTGCEDVAQQLVTSETGKLLNVIMGGGRQALVADVPTTGWDGIDESACNSMDKRNLLRDWQQQKLKMRKQFTVLQNRDDLQHFNGTQADYVLGTFANGNLKRNVPTMPSLKEMVMKAIDLLKRGKRKEGFLLVAETGSQFQQDTKEQINVILELNAVIKETLTTHSSLENNTLVLIVFTKGSYVKNALDTSVETEIVSSLRDILNDNNDARLEQHLTNVVTESTIYAKGPKSHLFHGLHEETYMAHAITYALQMGQFHKNGISGMAK